MKVFVFSRWGLYAQVFSIVVAMIVSLYTIYYATIYHAYTLYVLAAIFFSVGVLGIVWLWNNWPIKVIVYDDDTVEVFTIGGVERIYIDDILSVRFGRGVWLYHKKGKYAFSASFTNTPLWDLINELAERNCNFQILSGYISSFVNKRKY